MPGKTFNKDLGQPVTICYIYVQDILIPNFSQVQMLHLESFLTHRNTPQASLQEIVGVTITQFPKHFCFFKFKLTFPVTFRWMPVCIGYTLYYYYTSCHEKKINTTVFFSLVFLTGSVVHLLSTSGLGEKSMIGLKYTFYNVKYKLKFKLPSATVFCEIPSLPQLLGIMSKDTHWTLSDVAACWKPSLTWYLVCAVMQRAGVFHTDFHLVNN